jgi:carbonic anhydrase
VFIRASGLAGVGLATGVYGLADGAVQEKTSLTPDQALALLKQGNEKFVAGRLAHPAQDGGRRTALARGQGPFAAIVSCSDSRVPPEIVFDRGLGELFTIRVAGNTVDTAALGSVEYAVAVLSVPLVVVLGHERCGAVEAAIAIEDHNKPYPGSIGPMVQPIVPAAAASRKTGATGDALVDATVAENVRRVVAQLQAAPPILGVAVKGGRVRVVGARYDLDEGRVEFLS